MSDGSDSVPNATRPAWGVSIAFGLAVAASIHALGDLRPSFERLVVLVFAALGGAATLRHWYDDPRTLRRARGLATVYGSAVVALHAFVPATAAWLALWFASLATLRPRAREVRVDVDVERIALALMIQQLIGFALHRSEPIATAWIAGFDAASRVATNVVTGTSFRIGPSYHAADLLVFLVVLALLRIRARTWVRQAAAVATTVLVTWIATPAWLLACGLFVRDFGQDRHFSRNALFDQDVHQRVATDFASALFPHNVPLLVALTLVLINAAWAPRSLGAGSPAPVRAGVGRLGFACAVVAIVVPGWFAATRTPAANTGAKHVFLHNPYGNYFVPASDERIPALGVDFSAMAPRLRADGFRVTLGEIGVESLKDVDVLVLVNLPQRFEPTLQSAIQDWVRAGGALLCLGDHTGDEAIRLPFDALLAEAGIAYGFDSARVLAPYSLGYDDFDDGMRRAAELVPLSVADVRDYGIGASLTIRPPARALVVGRGAFSDPGDPGRVALGSIGNLRYDFGESIGDLVLVAEADVGAGRVVAFGDTSVFQTAALPICHEYARAAIARLLREHSAVPTWWIAVVAALGLVAAFASRPTWWLWCAAAMLVGFHAGERHAAQRAAWTRQLARSPDADLAWIAGRSTSSMGLYGERGASGVIPNLERRGLLPQYWWGELEEVPPGRFLFLLDPARTLSDAATARVLDFAEAGGQVVVCVAHENADALAPLLDALGVAVTFEPLARFRATAAFDAEAEVEFTSGWPLTIAVPHEKLVVAWGRTVAARIVRGGGAITVFGDGRLFENRNLEDQREVHARNIAFFKSLITHLARSS